MAKAQIEKQGEVDAAIDRLAKEFENVDFKRDGTVTIDEMTQYLTSRVSFSYKWQNIIQCKKGHFDPLVVEEIFNMIDSNNDGRVTLDEFTRKYVETRQRLQERLNETYKKIVDHKRQRDEMFQKLT